MAGHLTRDPELRFLQNQTAICGFSIATNKKWKDQQGNQQEKVCFVECVAWGKRGETINQYFKKGAGILIEGELELDQWDDKDTGQKRSKHKINVQSFSFMGSGQNNNNNQQNNQQSGYSDYDQPQGGYDGGYSNGGDDDIPF